MKLSIRIFIVYFLLIGIGFFLFANEAVKVLTPITRQAAENVLVDSANLLAELAEEDMLAQNIRNGRFASAVERYQARQLDASIWGVEKTQPDLVIYVTDASGIVIFHSHPARIGEDYSSWLDVSRTLRGEYGARTTRTNPDNELSSIMYVAAPVHHNGDLLGVLTIGQPNAGIAPFLEFGRSRLLLQGVIIIVLALVAGAVLTYWLTHSIRKLSDYVKKVGRGERARVPTLNEKELAELAELTDNMRRELEGKAYIENYVHTLAHEMKSPIAAIRGASELLQESSMSADERQKFLQNIADSTHRMQTFIDRLLSLASIENIGELEQLAPVDLKACLEREIDAKKVRCNAKNTPVIFTYNTAVKQIHADAFLIGQAVSNLLDNAIDFAKSGSDIRLTVTRDGNLLSISICNEGDWIPDYALPRIFDRFYSLARPDRAARSSGLGLNFVEEIAGLHNGSIEIRNTGSQEQPAVEAILSLPLDRH